MAHTIDLQAETRTVTGKKVKRLRHEGKIPGNMYGHGVEPTPIQVDAKALEEALRHASSTTLVNLAIGRRKARPVFIRDVKWALLRREPEHVDFMAVRMDEKIKAIVPIVTRGESPVLRNTELMLQHSLTAVQVEGLPGDLPEAIAVDVTHLTEADQAVHVSDLHLPDGVTLLTSPDELVMKIAVTRAALEPTVEAAAEPAEAAAEGAEAAEEAAEAPAAQSEQKS